MTPTRPKNNRSMPSRSALEQLESPPLSASSMSTPSITDDHDPLQHSIDADEKDDGVVDDDDRRGRSSTVEAARFEMDPRNMSPRRDSEELDQLGAETKARLQAQAQSLQSGLLALLERVDKVREEHDKLEGENRFLQEYIGSLMATSKITGSSRNSGGRLK